MTCQICLRWIDSYNSITLECEAGPSRDFVAIAARVCMCFDCYEKPGGLREKYWHLIGDVLSPPPYWSRSRGWCVLWTIPEHGYYIRNAAA